MSLWRPPQPPRPTVASGSAPGQVCAAVRTLQQVQDQVAAVQMQLMAQLDATKAYEDDGAGTLAAWARRELRLTPGEAAAMTTAGRTNAALPAVAASARGGSGWRT